jgi:RNase P/RNase MRP subunit p29
VSTASFPVSGGVNSAASPAAAAKVPGPAKQGVARAGGVWDGEAVPVDQIGAKMQILTPRVGRVRVTLASGDVKEGRLHAVGEGQLWLEVGRSFESIARANIERLEQIGGAAEVLAASSEKPAAKPAAPSSDKRVRVRTAGGLFYGKIVARDGDTLTLLTDEGARVTIEGGSIEAAPEHKTVVKHPAPPKPVTKPTPEQLPAAHGVEPGPDAEVPGVPPAPPGSR